MLLLFFVSFCFAGRNIGSDDECSFKSGDLLLTQPNEFFTHHQLAEFSTAGEPECYYDPGKGIKMESGIIDVAFFGDQGYVLDSLDGVFLINSSGLITRAFGKDKWPTIGDSHYGFCFDKDQNMYVVDLGTNSERDTKILKFSKDEEYLGAFLDLGSEFVPTDILADSQGYLWLTGGMSAQTPEVRKYSLKDGKLAGSYQSKQEVKFYGGIAEYQSLYYVNSEGSPPSSYDHVTVFTDSGEVKNEFDLYPVKGESGGGPNGMVVVNDQLYVMLSDPEMSTNSTQHVQVFNLDGTFVKQFGGHDCTTELCQTFNGLAVIP